MIGQFHLRQDDVATRVGKSRAAVANALRLLKLPADVQAHIREGRVSVGHAKVILGRELRHTIEKVSPETSKPEPVAVPAAES